MFSKIFGTKNKAPAIKEDPAVAAFQNALKEAKKKDPMAGLKIGAKEITHRISSAIQNDKGIHAESLLAVLGSLSGFSCQMAVWEGIIKAGMPRQNVLMQITDNAGRKYYFGDIINELLLSAKYSIWGLAGGGAQTAGCTELPDLNEIVSHYAASVGSEQFGVPRLPEGHPISDTPENYIRHIWPAIKPILEKFCDSPREWPVLMGLSLHNTIIDVKAVLKPEIALLIVMECAVPSSKYDPEYLNITV